MKLILSATLLASALMTSGLVHAASVQDTTTFFSSKTCTASEYETYEHSYGGDPWLVDSQTVQASKVAASGAVRVEFSDGEAADLSAAQATDGSYNVTVTALSSRFILRGYNSRAESTFAEASAELGNTATLDVPAMSRTFTVTCQ